MKYRKILCFRLEYKTIEYNIFIYSSGYVAELVANWFIGSGMDHECVVQLVQKQDELRRLEKEELEKMEDDSEQIDQMEVTSDAVPNDLKQVDGKIAGK